MKRFRVILFASLAMISCGRSAKDFASDFLKAINENNKAEVVTMYPGAESFEIISPIVADSTGISVVKEGNGHHKVYIGDMTIDVVKKDGSLHVADSWGLLAIPEDIREFAVSTGWVDGERTDLENALALKDEGFMAYVQNTLKDNFKLAVKLTSNIEWPSGCRTTYAMVTNTSDVIIPGGLYNVVMKECGLIGNELYDAYGNFNGYETYSSYSYRKGVDVPANGSSAIFVGCGDFEYGADYYDPVAVFNTKCDVTKLKDIFTGKEYENYLATKNR